MKRKLLSIMVCGSMVGSLAGLSGCNKPEGGGGGGGGGSTSRAEPAAVAIVDLDRVARDLGWSTKMQANLQTYQAQLTSDVRKYAGVYETEVQARLRAMLPKDTKENDKITLTPAQSQELTQYIVAGRQQVGQLAGAGDQLFAAYRANWYKQYRQALIPIVRQVAQEKKVPIVLSQTDTVLFTEPTMDLTDAVVDAARKQPPALTDVPMVPLEGPANISVNALPTTVPSTTQPAATKP